jgi:hypothetical protein
VGAVRVCQTCGLHSSPRASLCLMASQALLSLATSCFLPTVTLSMTVVCGTAGGFIDDLEVALVDDGKVLVRSSSRLGVPSPPPESPSLACHGPPVSSS